MKQIATYDISCTVPFYSVHHFCAGTALALCAIALLLGACAIITMASCTSLCQTYCTPLPSHNYHHPVKNGWCCCVLKKKIYRFCMDLTCTYTLRLFSPSGGSPPGLSCGCGYPSLYFYSKTWYLLLTPQQFHCCCVNKITQKNTHPTRQPCKQNSGYPAPISGHPFLVLLTAHCTMYSLGLDCWPCGSGYIHPSLPVCHALSLNSDR